MTELKAAMISVHPPAWLPGQDGQTLQWLHIVCPTPSSSSSPSMPRAENLGKAFPQTLFNLGLHTFRVEINPWKSWEEEGSEAQHPLRVFISFFVNFRGCAFFSSSAHPIPPLWFSSLFSLCPDLGAGMLSAAPAFHLLVLPLSIPCLK